jgi:uncharacterized repeat protein (TIGR01451 family)
MCDPSEFPQRERAKLKLWPALRTRLRNRWLGAGSVQFVPSARQCRSSKAVANSLQTLLVLPTALLRLTPNVRVIWLAAAATGTAGLILTLVLMIAGVVTTAEKRASAAGSHPVNPADPFDPNWDKQEEAATLDLDVAIARADVPADRVSPGGENQFLVTSRGAEPTGRMNRALDDRWAAADRSGSPSGPDAGKREQRPRFFEEGLLQSSSTIHRAEAGDLESEPWNEMPSQRTAVPAPIPQSIGGSHSPEAPGASESPNPIAPGPRDLDVTIEKLVPAASPAGEPLEYHLVVRNEGETTVARVVVEEQIPGDFLVADVMPAGVLDGRTMRWTLSDLQAGTETRLKVRLRAGGTGRAKAATRLLSRSAVSADTVVKPAEIELQMTLPRQVALGRACPIEFRMTNLGSTEASGLVLRTDLPEALWSRNGRALDYAVGSLAPGQTRTARLVARADRIGSGVQRATLLADGAVVGMTERSVRVVSVRRESRAICVVPGPPVCVPCRP